MLRNGYASVTPRAKITRYRIGTALAPRWAWKTTLGSWCFFRAFFSPLFISHSFRLIAPFVSIQGSLHPSFLMIEPPVLLNLKGNGLLQDILAEQRKLDRKWLEVNVMKRPWLFSIIWTLPWQKCLLQLWYLYEWDVNNLSQRYSDVTNYAKEIWVWRLSASFYFLLYIFWI